MEMLSESRNSTDFSLYRLRPPKLVLGLLAAVLPVPAQIAIVEHSFDPPVIRVDRSEPVLLEAKVVGNHDSVVFEHNTNPSPFNQPGLDFPMRDDGLEGDRVAGDAVYSLSLPANLATANLASSDVFRKFVGFMKVFQGSDLVGVRFNTFAQIITDEIPLMPVNKLSSTVQHTPYVVTLLSG